jgi:hypothetical protein
VRFVGNVGLAAAGAISGGALYWFYAGQRGTVGDAERAERAAADRRASSRAADVGGNGYL